MSTPASEPGLPSGAVPPPAVPPHAGSGSGPSTVPEAVRLQILATEHWSLLASRSLAWNESFSRAAMFLTTLSGGIIALALAAQVSGFGRSFQLFALAILPIVFYVGVATFIRIGESNYHDAQCVIGMNRIRAAYLEIAPDLERYFVMSANDDPRGISITMGVDPRRSPAIHLLGATPLVVAIVTSVVAGAIGSILAQVLHWGPGAAALGGVIGFAGCLAALSWYAVREIHRLRTTHRPLFPGADQP